MNKMNQKQKENQFIEITTQNKTTSFVFVQFQEKPIKFEWGL
jgi:hypothetical protein